VGYGASVFWRTDEALRGKEGNYIQNENGASFVCAVVDVWWKSEISLAADSLKPWCNINKLCDTRAEQPIGVFQVVNG
jgi:hypothetical protein